MNISETEFNKNPASFLETVATGKIVTITRDGQHFVVMISAERYKDLLKIEDNARTHRCKGTHSGPFTPGRFPLSQ